MDNLSPVEKFYFELKERTRIEKERQAHYDTLSPEEKRAYQKAKRKRGRPKKKKYYFTEDTQAAIVAYNNEEDDKLRNKVFNEYIYRAFLKLAENIIHTFKLYHFQCTALQLKHEAPVLKIDTQRDLTNEMVRATVLEERYDFMNQFIEYWEIEMYNTYTKKRDLKIVDAVLTLFKDRHNIENFNKKALYIMIREMTDVKTLYITRVINMLKKSYVELNKSYEKTGRISMPKSTFLN